MKIPLNCECGVVCQLCAEEGGNGEKENMKEGGGGRSGKKERKDNARPSHPADTPAVSPH